MTDAKSRFVYVIYIRTTAEELWKAMTSAEFMKQYWLGAHIESEWKLGAPWRIVYPDGRVTDEGEVAEFDPPRRFALRWRHKMQPEIAQEGEAMCEIELEPVEGAVKLTVNHSIARADSKLIAAVSGGWPRILSNLKSLIETGKTILKPK
jgi:uncharacterized protein YndB with AHSA1/START domain